MKVGVRIELGSALAKLAPDGDALAPVQRYADELVHDLALPLQVALQVTRSEDSAPADLRIWVHDRPCRIPQVPAYSTQDRRTLIWRISIALHENRELFLSDQVLEALWSKWTSRLGPCSSDVRDAVTTLVWLGAAVTPARAIATAEGASLPADSAVEKLVVQAGGRFRIAVSPACHAGLRLVPKSDDDQEVVERQLRMMNDGLFYELGLVFGLGAIEPDAQLTGDEFRIQVNELRMPIQVGLAADEYVVNDTVDRLTLLNIKGRQAFNPVNGVECAVVRGEADEAVCKQAGLTSWNQQGVLILYASAAIRRTADRLLTTDIVDFCCSKLGDAFPDLVARALQVLSPIFLTRVLRELLHEEISMRDLRSILEALLSVSGRTQVDWSKYIVFFLDTDSPTACSVGFGHGREAIVREHAEAVRMSFKRWISHKYMRSGSTLVVYLVGPEIEQRLADPAPLAVTDRAKLINAVSGEVGNLPPTAQDPVILTRVPVRARLRREIEKEFPALAVISYQELSPDVNIQPIARISIEP